MIVLFFETDMFNLSEEKEHFINPGCFGEDFASCTELIKGVGKKFSYNVGFAFGSSPIHMSLYKRKTNNA